MRNATGSLTKVMPPGSHVAMRRQSPRPDRSKRRGKTCDPIRSGSIRGGGEPKPVSISQVARGGTVVVDFGRPRDTHPPFPRGRSTTSPRYAATVKHSALIRAPLPCLFCPVSVCKGMRKSPVGRQRTVGREYHARSRGDDLYCKRTSFRADPGHPCCRYTMDHRFNGDYFAPWFHACR